MYQFEHEIQKEKRKEKVYSLLFLVFSLINFIFTLFEGRIYTGLLGLLIAAILLYLFKRKKGWAVGVVKFLVWTEAFVAILGLVAFLYRMLTKS